MSVLAASMLLLAQASPLPDMAKPPPEMAIDASPTAFACTFTSALRGEPCTYEAEPHAVPDAKANIRLASDQAARVCAADAQNQEQRAACVKLTEKAAEERCSGDGRGLADEQGRLTRAAVPCAVALRQVIFHETGRAIEASAPAEPAGPAVNTPPPARRVKPAPQKTKTPEKI